MNKILKITFLLFFGICFSQINVEEIKKNVTENPQKYYYDYLETFKKDPLELDQEQMNQLYYGSRFVKSEYEMSDYNKDYDEIWKIASRKFISKKKAQQIVKKAEEGYSKNPLQKDILMGLSNIYDALEDNIKRDLCLSQNKAIVQTIEKSGTGKSEDSPIYVINASDMLDKIKDLSVGKNRGMFDQKMKDLPDGSMLTTYSLGDEKIFVVLVGGFRF